MRFKKRVLCFGKDSNLLETRQWLLERLFHSVAVSTMAEFERLAAIADFDLVIFCHTLSSEECHRASTLARRAWPEAKILALTAISPACDPPDTDASLPGLDGPAVLLAQASAMLHVA